MWSNMDVMFFSSNKNEVYCCSLTFFIPLLEYYDSFFDSLLLDTTLWLLEDAEAVVLGSFLLAEENLWKIFESMF